MTSYATYNGEITDTGGENCDYRGFVWDTTSHADPGDTSPTDSAYASDWTESGSFGTGTFSHQVTGLVEDTTYYVRACAHNSAGWSYGGEVIFTTPNEVLVSDSAGGSEALSPLLLPVSDTGSGLETLSYRLIGMQDTGNGLENLSQLLIPVVDSGTGDETLSALEALILVTDTGSSDTNAYIYETLVINGSVVVTVLGVRQTKSSVVQTQE